MSLKKNLVDGAFLLFVVLAVFTYFFFQNMFFAFILFVMALTVAWFRRAIYRLFASS